MKIVNDFFSTLHKKKYMIIRHKAQTLFFRETKAQTTIQAGQE